MKKLFLLIGLVAMFAATSAQAQFTTSPNSSTFSDVPSIITTGATSNVLSHITVTKDANVTILPYFAGTNSGTAVLAFIFRVSADGSNWSTDTITKTAAMNGTTAVRPTIMLKNQTDLQGVKYLQLYQITNAHTASVFVTNVTYSTWK